MNSRPPMLCAAVLGWLSAGVLLGLQTLAAVAPERLAERDPSLGLSATASGESGGARLSPGGRFLLFVSTADDLVPHVHNGPVADLFIRDQTTGEVTLVSAAPDGLQGGDGETYQGVISEDGRWVAFESDARNLVAGEIAPDGVGFFLRDRVNQTTRPIRLPRPPLSLLVKGAPLEAPLAMDSAGQRVAMVHGGLVFVHHRETAVTTIITQPFSGDAVAGSFLRSAAPQFDASGHLLAFASAVPNLTRPAVGSLQLYVFRFDRGNDDPNRLVQMRLKNGQLPFVAGGYPVSDFNLSRDGMFLTAAVPPTTTPTAALGIVRFNLVSGEVQSLTAGMQVNRGSTLSLATWDSASSGPGGRLQRVAFGLDQGRAAGGTFTNGLFVWESDGTTERLQRILGTQTRGLTGTPLEFSEDGRRLLISTTDTNVVSGITEVLSRYALVDLETGTRTLVVEDSAEARNLFLSDAGGGVIFESSVSGLVESDLNESGDLFLDTGTGTRITAISRRSESLVSSLGGGMSSLGGGAFSADGGRWVFTSVAGDLVPGDGNGAADVFVRDRADGRLRLVSVDQGGAGSGNGPSGQPVISQDGRQVAFISGATNLVAEDANDRPDLFVRDLDNGVTSLVSVPPGGAVRDFAMSRNARRFLWVRGPGTKLQIQFRDLDGGDVRTLEGSSSFSSPVLSADGSVGMYSRRGMVFSFSAGSVSGPVRVPAPDNVERILLAEDGSRAVLFASRRGPQVVVRAPNGSYHPSPIPLEAGESRAKDGVLSPDGRWLAYAAILGDLPATSKDGNVGFRVFLLDLETGERLQISGSVGVFDSGIAGDADRPAFSADGRLVAYRAAAGNLVADDDNGADDVMVYDRLTGRTRLVSRDPVTSVPWGARSWRARFGARSDEVWIGTFAPEVVARDFNGAADYFRVRLPVDEDADGMEDLQEREVFQGLSASGDADADQDGVSNADELASGTDPKSADSVLRLQVEETPAGSGTWMGSWPSVPGRRYRVLIEYPMNGIGKRWGPVVTAVGSRTEVKLPPIPGDSEFYVRLVLED